MIRTNNQAIGEKTHLLASEKTHLLASLAAAVAIAPLFLGGTASSLALPAEEATVFGKASPATRHFPSVVILETDGAPSVPVPEKPVTIDQVDKTFVPGVVVARLGQPVEFHNSEEMLHNVHVVSFQSDGTVLNVAMPFQGQTLQHIFEEEGTYAVLCDVHPEMEAYIVVTSSPHTVVAGNDGSFELRDVPRGTYTLRIWNVKESLQSVQPLEVQGPRTEATVIGKQ